MSSSFWTWVAVAGALAVGLLMILGSPNAAPGEVVPADGPTADEPDASQYWEPVVQPSSATPAQPTAVAYQAPAAASGCAGCGIAAPTVQPAPVVAGGVPPTTRMTPISYGSGCGTSSQPCAGTPCSELTRPCPTPLANACSTCGRVPACPAPCLEKPRINRNMPLCVDECSFVQLHSTVPHPICDAVSFEWTAARGSFLNPHDPDPIYYAPGTRAPYGEDVWVVLTVVDQNGVRYTDQVQVHVNNTL